MACEHQKRGTNFHKQESKHPKKRQGCIALTHLHILLVGHNEDGNAPTHLVVITYRLCKAGKGQDKQLV